MKYDVISADCHVDPAWPPPDLFPANAADSGVLPWPSRVDTLRPR